MILPIVVLGNSHQMLTPSALKGHICREADLGGRWLWEAAAVVFCILLLAVVFAVVAVGRGFSFCNEFCAVQWH